MFASAQIGVGMPTADLKNEEGAAAGRAFLLEYALMQRRFGLGCTFMQGRNAVDKDFPAISEHVLYGRLQEAGDWTYQAIMMGPVIAVPFGSKHPGGFLLKAQGGLLRAKSSTLRYESSTIHGIFDGAFGWKVGLSGYWSPIRSVALTASVNLLKSETEFVSTSYHYSVLHREIVARTGKRAVDFGMVYLNMGILFWL